MYQNALYINNTLYIVLGTLFICFVFSLFGNFYFFFLLKRERGEETKKYHKDSLTGLYNGHFLREVVQKTYKTFAEQNRRKRDKKILSVIMIDIDFFKRYNDQFGHLEGDSCLRMVAEVIANSVKRETDIPIRYGGEEFLIILPDCDSQGALVIAERIRRAIAGLKIKNPAEDDPGATITVSLGIATIAPSLEEKLEDAVEKADGMMYKAKRSGRNRIARQT